MYRACLLMGLFVYDYSFIASRPVAPWLLEDGCLRVEGSQTRFPMGLHLASTSSYHLAKSN